MKLRSLIIASAVSLAGHLAVLALSTAPVHAPETPAPPHTTIALELVPRAAPPATTISRTPATGRTRSALDRHSKRVRPLASAPRPTEKPTPRPSRARNDAPMLRTERPPSKRSPTPRRLVIALAKRRARTPPRHVPRRRADQREPAPTLVKRSAQLPRTLRVGGPRTSAPRVTRPGTESRGIERPDPLRMSRYLARLNRLVAARKRYPEVARRMGDEGRVVIEALIGSSGTLRGEPTIKKSSGVALLDREALRMVTSAAPFPPLPGAWLLSRLRARFVVDFELP